MGILAIHSKESLKDDTTYGNIDDSFDGMVSWRDDRILLGY